MSRTITPHELKAMMERGEGITLLDVRKPHAFEGDTVMLPGAQWLDPAEIETWAAALPKDEEVILYCTHGEAVSNAVVDRLHDLGLKARLIEGGIEGWKAAGGATTPKPQK